MATEKRKGSANEVGNENITLKKIRTRKICEGCKTQYSRSYFFSLHKPKYFQDNKWTCGIKKSVLSTNDDENFNDNSFVPTLIDDDESDECGDSSNIEKLRDDMREFIRKRLCKLPNEDITEGNSSDSEEEIWNAISTDDIQMDIEDVQEVQKKVDSNSTHCTSITSLTIWFCLFICTWQGVNMISDTAINQLLNFVSTFLSELCKSHPVFYSLPAIFPGTLYMLWKSLNLKVDNFKKFVVCKKCCSLYTLQESSIVVEGREISANCTYVAFPNHTQKGRRTKCNESLMRLVKLSNGDEKLYPYKLYCYKPIIETIKRFLRRKQFVQNCNSWRQRNIPTDMYFDVYDGQVWKDFNTDKYSNFLASDYSFGLMLNLDWFQPFQHVKYSIGVIYAVVLNLPRHLRFKLENVILIGINPDMGKEPSTNTFVKPFVNELEEAWSKGYEAFSVHTNKNVIVKLAVMCVGCDVPATRKLCGFLGHTANLGCSKCYKVFPGTVGNKDYSGFDRDQWQKREIKDHSLRIDKVLGAKTKSEKSNLESDTGVRFSELSRLSYFDPIRMSIIDPMHNMYLGSAKHMIKVWLSTGTILEDSFEIIQKRVDTIETPASLGKIPRKISSSFGGFTAEQWMHWTNLFSVYALKGQIPDRLLHHWRFFVLASRLLCSRSISKDDIKLIDQYLLAFCKGVEECYGTNFVTPNMHLHAHIADCMLDYGPVHSFWLYSFERYNGYLGTLPNNNRSIELQLMRRFNRNAMISEIDYPEYFKEELLPVFESLTQEKETNSRYLSDSKKMDFISMSLPSCIRSLQKWDDVENVDLKHGSPAVLDDVETNFLKQMYKIVYQLNDDYDFLCSISFMKFKAVSLGNETIGSIKSRYCRSAYIMSNWNAGNGQIVAENDDRLWPGIVEYFLRHNLVLNGRSMVHILAKITWLAPNLEMKKHCGAPVEVWSSNIFDDSGPSIFLPIQRIRCKFVYAQGKVGNRKVLFIVPIGKNLAF